MKVKIILVINNYYLSKASALGLPRRIKNEGGVKTYKGLIKNRNLDHFCVKKRDVEGKKKKRGLRLAKSKILDE